MDPLRQIKRIYIDMDGVLCDFSAAHKNCLQENPDQPYPQSSWGFFSNLEPINDSINSVQQLMKLFDVWFLSTPSVYNLNSYTEKAFWIKKYFGLEGQKKLILSTDKSLLKGHYLIDDDCTKSQTNFEGQHIQFGTNEFKDWSVVLEYLILENSKIPKSKQDLWWGC